MTLGIVGSPGFIGAFFEWLPYVLAYLDILISVLAQRWWGDLFSLLFGMNANSGMAGPTAAFTSFQSCWLKWLCDTVCAAAHSHSQSLYFVPYLSPASFFFYCHLQCLCLSLSSFPFVWYQTHGIAHATALYSSMVFSFSTVHPVKYDFFVWVHMRFVCFFLSGCVLKWRERCRRTTSNSMRIWIGERAQKCVCV